MTTTAPAPLAPLTLTMLADRVRRIARTPALWREKVRFDAEQRWFTRLEQSEAYEIWLLSWLPGQGTEVHDHGGSRGAFAVAAGQLSERTYAAGRPAIPRPAPWHLPTGAIRGFGPRHVHEVANRGSRPAVSVHAYSPALTSMSYYTEQSGGGLLRVRTDLVEE
ncbi:cysteine dioxygenase [Streptomyces polyrhachis]|uniref:Cysteine dioxygenase n=1 Tax=Streptomyces polyrhachis TaxID=1282885 RepID=A0ABW2GC89_9ACTN